MRVASRDPMFRDPDQEATTYWTRDSHHTEKTTLHDMF